MAESGVAESVLTWMRLGWGVWLDGQKLEIEKDYLLSQCGNVTLERQRSQFPYCLEPKLQTCSVVVEKGVLMLQSEVFS